LNLLSTQAAIAIENAKLYSKLRTSESQMAQFLEAVPVAIAVLDAAGRPYYANQRRIQLVGKGIDPAVAPDQFAEVYQFYLAGTDRKYPTEKLPIIRALNGERTTVDDMEIHRNDATIPVEAWGTPVFDEQGNVAYAIVAFQDITERRRSEQLLADYNRTLEQQVAQRTAALQKSEAALRDVYDKLRLREQELRLITDALPALISYVDANRCYQFINRTYEDWFSRSRDAILGKYVHELLGEKAYQMVEPYINQVFEGQTVTLEAEIPYPLGKKQISATFIPDFDSNAQVRGFYGLITDIGDRKLAEAASILEERNRMAREIHDTLAQSFTGIIIHARSAASKITIDPEKAQAYLAQVQNLARTGLAEARRSVEALRRPYLLENNDLLSAFRHLTTQLESSTGTTIMCEAIGIPYPLPTEVENNLLRIGQEALTNALKYAKATEIRVELIYQSTQCILGIKDDGQGFTIDRSSSHKGFGLLGMSERANRIGAQLQIQSTPGQGTEIVVSVNQEQPS
jgi:PAS domain S-box-containing protein